MFLFDSIEIKSEPILNDNNPHVSLQSPVDIRSWIQHPTRCNWTKYKKPNFNVAGLKQQENHIITTWF